MLAFGGKLTRSVLCCFFFFWFCFPTPLPSLFSRRQQLPPPSARSDDLGWAGNSSAPLVFPVKSSVTYKWSFACTSLISLALGAPPCFGVASSAKRKKYCGSLICTAAWFLDFRSTYSVCNTPRRPPNPPNPKAIISNLQRRMCGSWLNVSSLRLRGWSSSLMWCFRVHRSSAPQPHPPV